RRGVSTVFIGMYDPNPLIYREGWRMLRDAGVLLRDFSPELRAEIVADNTKFIDSYRVGIGAAGTASFDYRQNGGQFEIRSAAGTEEGGDHWQLDIEYDVRAPSTDVADSTGAGG